MKKIVNAAGILLLLVTAGCIIQDSPEKIFSDFSKATSVLADEVTKADEKGNKKAVAAAFEKYGKRCEKLAERLQVLWEKNRKEKFMDDKAIARVKKDFESVAKDFATLITKMVKYITDSEVMLAIDNARKEITAMVKDYF